MTEQTPTRARDGDQDAFRELTDPYRRELRRHIYRIVGSPQDAEALLRETLLAAWRGIEPFQARVRPRVPGPHRHQPLARCAARGSAARAHERPALTERPEPTRYGDAVWLAPYPDALLDGIPDRAPGPEARHEAREAIALAFVAGLQHRPPQQRAVLVLRDVLGYRAAEVAALLETTQPSVNSLLRRARAAFESRLPTAGRERSPLPGSRASATSPGASPTPSRPGSRGRTRCWSSPCRASGSRPSRGSAAAACSPASGCRGSCATSGIHASQPRGEAGQLRAGHDRGARQQRGTGRRERQRALLDGHAHDVRDGHWKISVVQSPFWRRTSWARAGPSGRSERSRKKPGSTSMPPSGWQSTRSSQERRPG
jgi:RNA polymerase sigma factor (sigma-70 family)